MDIVWVTAAGPSGQTRRWNLLEDRHSLPGNVHGAEGAPVNVAYMGSEEEARREEFALLELRGGTFTSDRFASLRIEDGMVVADGLPAGDYKLVLRPSGREINLRVTEGEAGHGHVLGGAPAPAGGQLPAAADPRRREEGREPGRPGRQRARRIGRAST